jgi:hypothetical protein
MALAHHFSRSPYLGLAAGVLAATFRFQARVPAEWLSWYSYHQDLLLLALFQSSLLFYCYWIEKRRGRYLILTWGALALCAFTKEWAVILPTILWIVGRARNYGHPAGEVNRQMLWMSGALIIYLGFRAWAVPGATAPHFEWFHLVDRPVLYFNSALYRYHITRDYWLPGLAVVVMLAARYFVSGRRRELAARNATWRVVNHPFVLLPLLALVVFGYLSLTTPDAFGAIVILFDRPLQMAAPHDFLNFLMTANCLYLLWRCRKTCPTFLAAIPLMISWLPVIGQVVWWHYNLVPWFIRITFSWPILLPLLWTDAMRIARLIDLHLPQFFPPYIPVPRLHGLEPVPHLEPEPAVS